MAACVNTTKEWRCKATESMSQSRTVNEFSCQGLLNKGKGKRNIVFVWFTEDGDVFGGCESFAVTEQDVWLSRDGRSIPLS